MRLYFVRHGKTEWNLEGRFQGANGNSPLLEESISQLQDLGQYLKDIPFDAIYSSDLERALTSAQIINQENKQPLKTVTTTPQLREWFLGKLEGQKISLIKAIYPSQMKAFRHNLACFNSKMFNAESLYQTTQRVRKFVESLETTGAEHVLIIGHGANLTASIQTLLGQPPARLRRFGGLDNASLTILETQDFKHFDLIVWNDTSYQDLDEASKSELVQQSLS